MKILTGKDKLIYERLVSIANDYSGFLQQLSNTPDKIGMDYKEIKVTRYQLDSMLGEVRATLKGYNDYWLKRKLG